MNLNRIGRSYFNVEMVKGIMRCNFHALQFVLPICAMLVLSNGSVLAQATLGSAAVGGTVRDTKGSIVPDATVVLTDTARGFPRETKTDSAGLFQFPSVTPSHYDLRVNKESFQTFEMTDILVELGDSKSLDVVLPVGTVSSTVSVVADKATALDTGSNAIGNVITARTIGNLPLNTQDFLQLTLLAGGAQVPAGASNNTGQIGHADRAVILAGNGSASTAYTINGIATRGSRLGESALNISTADIDQFKVQESFFMPDQGPDPGIVNVTTKAGTNGLHGEAYEFLKNDYLDAVNYFATLPQELKRNQFGAAVGGPIRKNKMWFFVNYEGTRQVATGVASAVTPTAAEFDGDFSALLPTTVVYDPTTYSPITKQRKPFPGNKISPNQINPVAKALLAYYLPGSTTTTNGKNFEANPKSTYDDDQFGIRIDAALTANQFIFGQYIHQNDPVVNPGTFPDSGTLYANQNQLFVVQHTWTIRPTFINALRFGAVRLLALQTNQASSLGNIADKVGVPNTFDGRGVPAVRLTGYTGFGNAGGDIGNIDNNYQLDDNATYVRGVHSYQFGAGIRYMRDWQQNGTAQANSTLTFLPQFTAQLVPATGVAQKNTGNAFADFLLGDVSQAGNGGLPMIQYRFTQFLPYFADTWKISPTVTVNYGIGWFLATTPNPQGIYQGWVHSFDYNTQLVTYHALGQVSSEIVPTPLNHFTPRLGVAWNPASLPNTVIRAAFGTYFIDQAVIESQYGVFAPPFSQNTTLVNANNAPQPVYALGKNIFTPHVYPPLTPAFPSQLKAAGGSTIFILNPHARTPYVNQWDFSIQQALTRRDVVEATYLGNSGHKLLNHYDPAACTPTAQLQCIPSTNPYPNYTSLLTSSFDGNSNYNGLIVKYRHITSNGLTLDADYTYSKAMSDASSRGGLQGNQIATCRRCDYGPTSFTQKHRFVLSYVYELPFGRGNIFGAKMPTAIDLLAGGWVLTGIATFQSGVPISLTSANTTGVVSTVIRPNQVCNGTDHNLQNHLRTNGYKWFNTACYPTPAVGYFGNSGFDPITGPGSADWDVGAQKLFPIPVGSQTNLQLRIEAFNVLNHPRFGQPNSVSSTPATYGIITSADSPRVFQLTGKITF